MMNVSLILRAIDRASAPIRAVAAAVDKLGSVTQATARVTGGALGRIGTNMNVVGQRASTMSSKIGTATGRFDEITTAIGRTIVPAAILDRGILELTRTMEVLDRITVATVAPVNRVTAAIERMTWTARSAGSTVAASFGRIGTAAHATGSRIMGMNDFVVDAAHHFRTLAGPEGMERAGRSAAYLKSQVSGLTSGLSILKYASFAAVLGLGGEFVRGVFKAGGDMQTMMVTLTKLEGSATKAGQAMRWMTSFGMGAGARFSMPDIMRSYQQAMNFGMNPQGGSMAAFADLAAGERVPMKQVLLAAKDAMEGTSTRPLANLGIKMKQGKKAGEGNSYLYSDLAGKFVTERSEKTPEATLHALVRIINSKYSGLATAQAKTVPGGIEQLKKMLYLFEAKVANAGVLDWALSRMNRFFAFIRRMSGDGSLDRLAKRISTFITNGGDKIGAFLSRTNWAAVGRDIKALAAALVLVAGAIGLLAKLGGGGLSGLFNLYLVVKIVGITRALIGLWAAVRAGSIVLFGFGRVLLGLFVAGGPIVWAIGAVALLGGAAYLLWNNWSIVVGWLRGLWSGMPKWLQKAVVAFGLVFAPFLAFPALIIANWRPLTAFFKGLWASISNWQPPAWMRFLAGAGLMAGGNPGAALAMLAPRPAPPRAIAADPYAGAKITRVGGQMTIEFKNPPAGMAVTRLQKAHPGFDLAIRRGQVMGTH